MATRTDVVQCRLDGNMDDGNPYLTPLLDPSMSPGGTMDTSQNCYAAETQGSSPASALPSKATAETGSGNPLSGMSMIDAVKCITAFLQTDPRSAGRQHPLLIGPLQDVSDDV